MTRVGIGRRRVVLSEISDFLQYGPQTRGRGTNSTHQDFMTGTTQRKGHGGKPGPFFI